MEDIHQRTKMKKEMYSKTEFQVEDVKYHWIKQEIKEDKHNAELQRTAPCTQVTV